MKKDYIPISGQDISAEAAFVEKCWSDTWRGKDLAGADAVRAVDSREEFAILRRHLDRLPRAARLLDAGCGLGQWTIRLAQLGYDCTGLDISAETIGRLSQAGVPGAYRCGDIRASGYPDASFDMVFSWGVFEHFEAGPDECFRESFRVLKPGGILLASVPFLNGRHQRSMNTPLRRGEYSPCTSGGGAARQRFYQWRLTKREIVQQGVMVGFVVAEVHMLDRREGVRRMLANNVPMLAGSRWGAIAEALLTAVLPRSWISHMILVACRKAGGCVAA